MADAFALRPGMTVDQRYLLDEPLADQGLGDAFQATDAQADDRWVCIKILPAVSGEHARWFMAYAEAVQNLQHPNLVPWTAYGVEARRPYVVQELAPGESLATWIARIHHEGTLPDPHVVWQIMDAVCAGVDAVHTGVGDGPMVHGGITPGSVRLTPMDHGGYDVGVMDPGLAVFAGEMDTRPFEYVAPEADGTEDTQDNPDLGPATDVHSLAVLLIDCLMARPSDGLLEDADGPGEAPVIPDTWWQAVRAHNADLRGLLGQLRGDVHPSVWNAVVPALRRLPEQRYPTAGRFREALAHAHWVPIAVPPPAAPAPQVLPGGYDLGDSTAQIPMDRLADAFGDPPPTDPPPPGPLPTDPPPSDREHTMLLDEAGFSQAVGASVTHPPQTALPAAPSVPLRPMRAPTIASVGPFGHRAPAVSHPPPPAAPWDPPRASRPGDVPPWPGSGGPRRSGSMPLAPGAQGVSMPPGAPGAPMPPGAPGAPMPPGAPGMSMPPGPRPERQAYFQGFHDAAPRPVEHVPPPPPAPPTGLSPVMKQRLGYVAAVVVAVLFLTGAWLAMR